MPPVKKKGKAVSRKAKAEVEPKLENLEQEVPVVENGKPRKFSKSEIQDEERRQKALAKIHPEAVQYVKDKLGLDLKDPRVVDTQTLYDIVQGKVTKALPLIVVPQAYDPAAKALVDMPKIKVMDSIRIDFPKENGKSVAPSVKVPYIETIACRPFLEKAEGFVPERAESPEVEQKPFSFSDKQLLALEGIGINRDRLYGGFNYLPREVKADIAEGRTFFVDGQVKTDFGYVKVIGEARLDGDAVRFQSTYPEAREENTILDLRGARIQGNMEFDFFLRDSNRRVITDVNGVALFNAAAENLTKYGMAMEPVMGRSHTRKWDEKKGEFKDVASVWEPYQVSVVNGNLYATKMRQVVELGEDGKPIMETDRSGQEVEKTHPEANVRTRDGKVFLDNQGAEPKEFRSPQDYENFKRGKVAVVKDVVFHDYKNNKDVTYEAAVVADNRAAGYGKAFTPATSKELIAKMDTKKNVRRKQNYSFGL